MPIRDEEKWRNDAIVWYNMSNGTEFSGGKSPPHESIDLYSPMSSLAFDSYDSHDDTSPDAKHPGGADEFYEAAAVRIQSAARLFIARKLCLTMHSKIYRSYRITLTARDLQKLVNGDNNLYSSGRAQQSRPSFLTDLFPTATYLATHTHERSGDIFSNGRSRAYFSEERWNQAALAERFLIRGKLATGSLTCTLVARASFSTLHRAFGQASIHLAEVLPFPALNASLAVSLSKYVEVAVTDRTGSTISPSLPPETMGTNSEAEPHQVNELVLGIERSPLHRSKAGWMRLRTGRLGEFKRVWTEVMFDRIEIFPEMEERPSRANHEVTATMKLVDIVSLSMIGNPSIAHIHSDKSEAISDSRVSFAGHESDDENSFCSPVISSTSPPGLSDLFSQQQWSSSSSPSLRWARDSPGDSRTTTTDNNDSDSDRPAIDTDAVPELTLDIFLSEAGKALPTLWQFRAESLTIPAGNQDPLWQLDARAELYRWERTIRAALKEMRGSRYFNGNRRGRRNRIRSLRHRSATPSTPLNQQQSFTDEDEIEGTVDSYESEIRALRRNLLDVELERNVLRSKLEEDTALPASTTKAHERIDDV